MLVGAANTEHLMSSCRDLDPEVFQGSESLPSVDADSPGTNVCGRGVVQMVRLADSGAEFSGVAAFPVSAARLRKAPRG